MAEIIDTLDRPAQVESERHSIEQKLRRLGKAYVDGLLEEDEYEFQQRIRRCGRMARISLSTSAAPN